MVLFSTAINRNCYQITSMPYTNIVAKFFPLHWRYQSAPQLPYRYATPHFQMVRVNIKPGNSNSVCVCQLSRDTILAEKCTNYVTYSLLPVAIMMFLVLTTSFTEPSGLSTDTCSTQIPDGLRPTDQLIQKFPALQRRGEKNQKIDIKGRFRRLNMVWRTGVWFLLSIDWVLRKKAIPCCSTINVKCGRCIWTPGNMQYVSLPTDPDREPIASQIRVEDPVYFSPNTALFRPFKTHLNPNYFQIRIRPRQG